jgi:ferrochelatase
MTTDAAPTGVLLLNVGTPDAPQTPEVRRYLAEFLSDPRVIDIPAIPRWLLLHGSILRTRPRASAAQYRKVWTDEGSPLLVHGRALRAAVAQTLGAGFRVELAMRYGRPDIATAIEALCAAAVRQIVLLPLFPQFSEAATGSALARVREIIATRPDAPPLRVHGDFYDDPGFIESFAQVARPELERFGPDHVLFSYHGLPERQIRAGDASNAHCLATGDCCDRIGSQNPRCYRAQCFATSRALRASLGISLEGSSVAFQSRLGRTPWIQPFTDVRLPELAANGVARLAIMCPAFVADCLETLEEIALRARDQWRELGGDALALIPSLNAHPTWVAAVAEMVRRTAS